MKHYKVVRTYDDGCYEGKLQAAFDDGYEFVRASEYIHEITHNGRRRYGYIEYILAKEESEESNADSD